MAIDGIGQEVPVTQQATEPSDEQIAEVEAAFSQAIGSAIIMLAMENMSMLKESLDE